MNFRSFIVREVDLHERELEDNILLSFSTIGTRALFTIQNRFQLSWIDGRDVNEWVENHGEFGSEGTDRHQ